MTTITSGQTLNISAGQTSSGVVVLSGGTEFVDPGRIFHRGIGGFGVIDPGGTITIRVPGGVAVGTILNGGNLTVAGGSLPASAIGTVIDNGGTETVDGYAAGGAVNSGGVERVFGFATGDTVNDGGRQYVSGGGAAIGTTLSGGIQTVASGGAAGGTIVDNGGRQVVKSGGSASGTVLRGGVEIVSAGGIASNTVISGGTLDLVAGGSVSGSVSFATATGLFEVNGKVMPAATISGFRPGGTIDLRGIVANATNYAGGVVTLTDGGVTQAQLHVAGSYSSNSFKVAADGHGGTLVTDPPAAAVLLTGFPPRRPGGYVAGFFLTTRATPPTTFGDIAPAGLPSGAPSASSTHRYLQGCKIAGNSDPLRGGFRVQSRPL